MDTLSEITTNVRKGSLLVTPPSSQKQCFWIINVNLQGPHTYKFFPKVHTRMNFTHTVKFAIIRTICHFSKGTFSLIKGQKEGQKYNNGEISLTRVLLSGANFFLPVISVFQSNLFLIHSSSVSPHYLNSENAIQFSIKLERCNFSVHRFHELISEGYPLKI